MKTARQLVSVHRWLGVVLCLFFAMWFASGAVLIYVPFPSLPEPVRWNRAAMVDPTRIALSPSQAIHAAGKGEIERLRVVGVNDRPVYVLHPRDGRVTAVDAASGEVVEHYDARIAGDIAAGFADQQIVRVDGPIEFDQWVVSDEYDQFRPFHRVVLADSAGTVLYVSARSGEVVQRTTRRERAWNYAGAVVHWIYPTVLRRHWVAWDQFVWWLSLTGIVVAAIGMWLGISRIAGKQRSGGWKLSAFRGWLKWHHLLGLCAGLLTLSWVFSGWLSMDHGRIFSVPTPPAFREARFRGSSLDEAASAVGAEDLRLLRSFREIEINAIAGIPVVIGRDRDASVIYRYDETPRRPASELPFAVLERAVRAGWPEFRVRSAERLGENDPYGQLRAGALPPSTLRIKLDDPAATWVHVDASSGTILSITDRSRRIYRWLYNGLHHLDFPVLARHRPLWDIVMLTLLLAGFIFSITAVVIAVRRARWTVEGLKRPA